MNPQLVFSFPFDVDAQEAIYAVANHFALGVSIAGAPSSVPAHLKQAVENFNPASGTEVSPAVAFGALLNGAAGPNVSAPSSAVVGTLATAQTGSAATSAISPPVSSVPALPNANAGLAPSASAGQANPAVTVDKEGLPHDPRIHSKEPTLTDKGVWRKRRAVSTEVVKRIEAELRAILALPAPSATDEIARKAAAVAFAHSEAIRVVGAQPMSDEMLNAMLAGKPQTVSIPQSEWYVAYFAKRNAAYMEFMAKPTAIDDNVHFTAHNQLTPQVPTAPIVNAGTIDATGLPWDARINLPLVNGNALKDPAGVFVQRFDVPAEVKLAVMAELRANFTAASSAQATPDTGGIPAVPTVSAAEAGTTFPLLMRWVVQNQLAGKVTPASVADVVKQFGFVNAEGEGQLTLMSQRFDYFPSLVATLQAYGAV